MGVVCGVYDTGRLSGRPAVLGETAALAIETFFASPDGSGVLILGEAHDNPHHHKLRSRFLTRGAVVLEQLHAGQQAGLETYAATAAALAPGERQGAFKSAVEWDQSGWAKYPYDPLLQALVASGLPIVAGDPPKDKIRAVAREGPAALPPVERAGLGLDAALAPVLADASLTEIEAAHCGMMPKAALGPMAFAQRYRDAHLADATLTAAEVHGFAILLTGNNHARTDRGVPWFLRARAPGKQVVSVLFVEVEPGRDRPEDYTPLDPEGKPAADFLVFTPPAERGDPCAAFKK